MSETVTQLELTNITAKVIAGYVTSNIISAHDLPNLIHSVFTALSSLSNTSCNNTELSLKPAVSIKKSVTDEYIVCLEDGRRLKMLRRYLQRKHQMTIEQYFEKWSLPPDYPTVAPKYSIKRSNIAKANKLGFSKTRRRKRKNLDVIPKQDDIQQVA